MRSVLYLLDARVLETLEQGVKDALNLLVAHLAYLAYHWGHVVFGGSDGVVARQFIHVKVEIIGYFIYYQITASL